jgi:hypothetical protein
LNQQERFWEAQKIFTILIPVLSREKVEKLFQEYCDGLTRYPRTDAAAIAELAATNAYLLWVSREVARDKYLDISSEVFEQGMKAESLLLYLFGTNADLRGGRFNEWQESLLLLLKNTGPNVKFKSGRAPLSWATEKGYEDIVKVLLKNKADPNSKDQSGRTPLSWAAGNGHEGIVRLLLETKADLDLKDKDGRTPLS